MNATSNEDRVETTAQDHHSLGARIQEVAHHLSDRLHHTQHTNPEPTMVELVNQVVALHRGESCELRLNPQTTRIDHVEQMLAISVRQIGRTIAVNEHPDGEDIVVSITITDDTLPHAWSAVGEHI